MPSTHATRVVPPVPGSGEAELITSLCDAVDAIAVAMDDTIERLPDQARQDVFALPGILPIGAAEIRNRLSAWLAVEEQIANGQAERCDVCGDVVPLTSLLAHRADLHQEAGR
jgi:hypothetical protein